jgi:hypothetical protein
MNAEVEIEIDSRESVSAVPTIALRAESDIPTAALMLGLTEAALREMLADSAPAQSTARSDSSARQPTANRGNRIPEGVDTGQLQAIIAKRRSGDALTSQEEALIQRMQQQLQQSGGGFGGGGGGMGGGRPAATPSITDYQFGGDYWVVAIQDGEPVPMSVRTGLTDMEYSEIVAGLDADAQVLLLPSSSLFEQQETIQNFISSRVSTTPFQSTAGTGGGTGRGFR